MPFEKINYFNYSKFGFENKAELKLRIKTLFNPGEINLEQENISLNQLARTILGSNANQISTQDFQIFKQELKNLIDEINNEIRERKKNSIVSPEMIAGAKKQEWREFKRSGMNEEEYNAFMDN